MKYLNLIISITSLIISLTSLAVGIYFPYFRKVENVSSVIYKLSPFTPEGKQLISIEVGFTNNGNKNATISKIALCFPNIHSSNYCDLAFDQETNQALAPLTLKSGDLIIKTLYFPSTHVPLPEVKFFNEEHGFLNMSLHFTTINSNGGEIEKYLDKFFVTINKQTGLISGSSTSNLGQKIKLLQ